MNARQPARMTYNNAINIMLSVLGEQPYNSTALADGEVTADVEAAKNVLGEVSAAVQSEGWNFNTEADYPLQPNSDDNIVLPANVLRWFFPPDKDPTNKYIQVGTRLYNRVDHTYTITDTLKPTIIWNRSFDDLPESAKWYITVRAARVYQGRMLSSPTVHQFSEADEMRAKSAMVENEAENMQANFLNHQDVGLIAFRYNNILS